MNIRTGLTREQVLENMLELAVYLSEQSEQKDAVNNIEVTVNGLHMNFEAWTDDDGESEGEEDE